MFRNIVNQLEKEEFILVMRLFTFLVYTTPRNGYSASLLREAVAQDILYCEFYARHQEKKFKLPAHT